MFWYHFPPEIRNKILFTLVEDKSCKLASAAAVCREWQAIIEPHTFAYIRLTPSRLAKLNSMTKRNRSLVHYLWFCIELPPYNCMQCDWSMASLPLPGTSMSEDKLILKAFRSLFSTLSVWESSGNLTLDISLYSKSDNEHAFKYITFMPDAQGHGVQQMSVVENEEHDKHRWVARAPWPLLPLPPPISLRLLFEDVWLRPFVVPKCGQWTPMARAVTRLVMRLQTHRYWDAATITHIVSSLPGLREFHYEPWRQWEDRIRELSDTHAPSLLSALEGLNKVTIFENFNQRYPFYFPGASSPTRPPNWSLGQQLAQTNLGTETLSASFMVDAEAFFSVTTSSWPNLTHLTLTSRSLAPETRTIEIRHLLEAAGSAACRMPKLKTMEIWNGLEGLAALFKFEFVPGQQRSLPSVLTWRATWHLNLEIEVIDAWDKVVRHRDDGGDGVRAVYESVDPEEIRSHGDAIVSLKLSETVIRPISLQQILREHSFIRSLDAQAVPPVPSTLTTEEEEVQTVL